MITTSTDHVHLGTGPSRDAERSLAARRGMLRNTSPAERRSEGRPGFSRQMGQKWGSRKNQGTVYANAGRFESDQDNLGVTLLFLPLLPSPPFSLLPPFFFPTSFTSSQGSTARGLWPLQTLRGPLGLSIRPCAHHGIGDSQSPFPYPAFLPPSQEHLSPN